METTILIITLVVVLPIMSVGVYLYTVKQDFIKNLSTALNLLLTDDLSRTELMTVVLMYKHCINKTVLNAEELIELAELMKKYNHVKQLNDVITKNHAI